MINAKLRLYRLEMATQNIEDAVENSQQTYIFEITNMSEAELQALSASEQQGATAQTTAAQSAQDKAKSNQPTNPQPRKNENNKNDAEVPKTLPVGL